MNVPPASPNAGGLAVAPIYLSELEAAATARFPTFAGFAFDRGRVEAAMAAA